MGATVLQSWVADLTLMQQTVLLTAVRGPDGVPKYGPNKMLLRWYRRCILLSAMDRSVLTDPMQDAGGSFTGPSIHRSTLGMKMSERQRARVEQDNEDLINDLAEIGEPMVFSVPDDRNPWTCSIAELIEDQEREDGWEPLMHEITGQYLRELDAIPHHFQLHFLHAVEIVGYKHPDLRIRRWWLQTYERLVHDMHLWPETEEQLDRRLGDNRAQWLERNDVATVD